MEGVIMSPNIHHNPSKGKANRLIEEKSPYLLQHAYNPVDWYPWRPEAFEKAKAEDKPIFLSIGYSTCHWCHVMEKESFEDPQVASLMNDAFVSVKVDREERPDIDHIYMTVCNMMTGSGGWPLTIIMTPEKEPFFAATYIPKHNRYGRMGMLELIPRIKHVWRNRRKDVLENAANVRKVLADMEGQEKAGRIDASLEDAAFRELKGRFDSTWGGFGDAPKFPTPHNLFFLLRYWKRTGREEPLFMVRKTLEEMRRGGIFDHIGYGFHRYSTDKRWLVPHFEKMLYDQALLTIAYTETFQATGDASYRDTAGEIISYVLRDLASPEGGFYSAEDADSEGEEGRFYVWKASEIREALSAQEAALAMEVFNCSSHGNFNEEATGKATGANILHLTKTLADKGREMGIDDLPARMELIRRRLFELRQGRIRPHRDDKVLTDWNGLMIAALAKAAQVFGDNSYMEAARGAAEFFLSTMKKGDGRLLHRWRQGDADIEGNLDDYTFLQWGLLELYEAGFETRYLKEAIALADLMLRHFWDSERGAFYFAPDDATDLIVRKKEFYDGALPSGNSVALMNMLRLSRITGNARYEGCAEEILRAASGQLGQVPSGYTHLLCGLDFYLGPSHEIVIAGRRGDPATTAMLRALQERFIPNKVVVFRPSDEAMPSIDGLAEFASVYRPVGAMPTAYVCSGRACRRPVTAIEDMLAALP
jgi:uncharacterized protein YyaL (SSP411 family)